jgi:hypothetical protein
MIRYKKFRILIPKFGLRVLQTRIREEGFAFNIRSDVVTTLKDILVFGIMKPCSLGKCLSIFLKAPAKAHLLHVVPWIYGQEFAERPSLLQQVSNAKGLKIPAKFRYIKVVKETGSLGFVFYNYITTAKLKKQYKLSINLR